MNESERPANTYGTSLTAMLLSKHAKSGPTVIDQPFLTIRQTHRTLQSMSRDKSTTLSPKQRGYLQRTEK